MMKKRIKQAGVFIFALALVLGTFTLAKVQAALAVDTARKCSVQVNVPEVPFAELGDLEVTVDLYKVADMDESGAFIAAPGFEALSAIEEVDSETTAAEWEGFAVLAKETVEAGLVAETATGTTANGSVTFDGLDVGLYLVDAQTVLSPTSEYTFNPVIVAVPNNYFYTTGNEEWVYDLTGENAVVLKPEQADRFGNLEIEKTLDAFNDSVGGATFVFQVEAVKNGELVYSDVVSMTFDSAGQKNLVIEGIPAGAVVTVTEVYSGASYTLTSDGSQTVTILADEVVGTEFTNTYDEGLNSGDGLVNHFSYDAETGEWTHSATKDSTK